MTKNKAISYFRHEEVKKKYNDYTIDSSDMIEEDYREHEGFISKIKLAIEELPPQGRTVFKMCLIENRHYKVIAEELDISVNTVKTHISKSLKLLRHDFSGEMLLFFISAKKE